MKIIFISWDPQGPQTTLRELLMRFNIFILMQNQWLMYLSVCSAIWCQCEPSLFGSSFSFVRTEFGLNCIITHLKKRFLYCYKRKKKVFKKKLQFLQEGKVPVLHKILPQAIFFLGICD